MPEAAGVPDSVSIESRRLGRIILVQAALLAAAYIAGTWLTLEVKGATVTTPEVEAHGVLSAAFVAVTGLVAMLALIQKRRGVFWVNFVTFVYLVLAGVTGFAFLGNTSDPATITMANVSMMAGIGLGMPATGYSLMRVWEPTRQDKGSLVPTAVYIALGSLALTVVAGTLVAGINYSLAISIHVGLGALTVATTLGVMVISLMEAAEDSVGRNHQRIWLSLVGLGAASIAAGDGVVAVTAGGISYVVIMAEVTVLVYAFLMVTVAAPLQFRFPTLGMKMSRKGK